MQGGLQAAGAHRLREARGAEAIGAILHSFVVEADEIVVQLVLLDAGSIRRVPFSNAQPI